MGIGEVKRAVFLDRDGVLNEAILRDGKPYAPASVQELRLTEGAAEKAKALKELGYLLLVVTNQPDVGRGKQTIEALEEINKVLRSNLPIDDIFMCLHGGDLECDCRKPKPGLLLQGMEKYGLDRDACFMVGDRWRDIDAGAAAGVRTIFIDYHYREQGPAAPPTATVGSFHEAADFILGQEKP